MGWSLPVVMKLGLFPLPDRRGDSGHSSPTLRPDRGAGAEAEHLRDVMQISEERSTSGAGAGTSTGGRGWAKRKVGEWGIPLGFSNVFTDKTSWSFERA